MTKIVLKSLHLVNFKGAKDFLIDFGEWETFVYGRNRAGKSRIMDAYLWLLFGKDAQNRENYKVRTIVDNEPLHHVECSVTGEFMIDGTPLTLKREFNEIWATPKGEIEKVFKGNETLFFWNQTPISATDYKKRISQIMLEDILKIITNPRYFCTMLKWDKMREYLMLMAGMPTNDEIIANNPELGELKKLMNGKSFEDYKGMLKAQKKDLKDELATFDIKMTQANLTLKDNLICPIYGISCSDTTARKMYNNGNGEDIIKELEKEGRERSQQIAEIERQEMLIEKYRREMIRLLEPRINAMFSHVQFQLFDYTQDGTEVECCNPVMDGVPFGALNNEAQVNAGIDIINKFSEFYGVSAPLFVDNRESILNLCPTEAQTINFIVSKCDLQSRY